MTATRRVREEVPIEGPCDVLGTARFLHAGDDLFVRFDAGGLTSAVRTPGGPAIVRIKQPERAARSLQVELVLPRGADAAAALAAARDLAGLPQHDDDAHSRFLARVAREPSLEDALAPLAGLRVPRQPDAALGVTRAILAQQITTSFARQLAAAVFAKWAERVTIDGSDWMLPPRAEVLAAIPPDEMRALKVSTRKAEYIASLCAEIANGTLDLRSLGQLASASEASEALVARRGIGPTTAAWLLMFVGGHPDAWPPADVGLNRALASRIGPHDGRAARAFVERFAGVRSYLAIMLWSAQRLSQQSSKQ